MIDYLDFLVKKATIRVHMPKIKWPKVSKEGLISQLILHSEVVGHVVVCAVWGCSSEVKSVCVDVLVVVCDALRMIPP